MPLAFITKNDVLGLAILVLNIWAPVTTSVNAAGLKRKTNRQMNWMRHEIW